MRTFLLSADTDAPVEFPLGAVDVHVGDALLLDGPEDVARLLVARDADLAAAGLHVALMEEVGLAGVRVADRVERVGWVGRLLDARVEDLIEAFVLALEFEDE